MLISDHFPMGELAHLFHIGFLLLPIHQTGQGNLTGELTEKNRAKQYRLENSAQEIKKLLESQDKEG